MKKVWILGLSVALSSGLYARQNSVSSESAASMYNHEGTRVGTSYMNYQTDYNSSEKSRVVDEPNYKSSESHVYAFQEFSEISLVVGADFGQLDRDTNLEGKNSQLSGLISYGLNEQLSLGAELKTFSPREEGIGNVTYQTLSANFHAENFEIGTGIREAVSKNSNVITRIEIGAHTYYEFPQFSGFSIGFEMQRSLKTEKGDTRRASISDYYLSLSTDSESEIFSAELVLGLKGEVKDRLVSKNFMNDKGANYISLGGEVALSELFSIDGKFEAEQRRYEGKLNLTNKRKFAVEERQYRMQFGLAYRI